MKEQNSFSYCYIRLLRELRLYKFQFLLSCGLFLSNSALSLANGFLLGKVVDDILFCGESFFWGWLLTVVLLSLLINTADRYYWGRLHNNISFSLREKMESKLNDIEFSWIEMHQSGDIVTRLNSDAEETLSHLSRLKNVMVTSILGIASLSAIAYIQPLLAICAFLLPILSQLIIFFSSKKLDSHFRKRQELLGRTLSCSKEILEGLFEVKAMGYKRTLSKKYYEKVNDYVSHLIYLEKPCAITDIALSTLGKLQNILPIILGGLMAFSGEISLGDLLTVQIFSSNVSRAVNSLNLFQFRSDIVSISRIVEILDFPSKKSNPNTGSQNRTNSTELVSFEKVSFFYPQRQMIQVIQDIDLSINRGEKVAIVGPSGSGKSTILKLIAGLYTPSSGVLNVTTDKIAMIDQETFLFEDTAYQNIACGDNSMNQLTVEKAAADAELIECIQSMPHGFHTICFENGKNLSGGQKQRFSIARCLCRDSELLLLDEPTSSLDSTTGSAIMEKILELFAGKTLVLVTHDLTLLQKFDMIYVINQGSIVEKGTHEILLHSNGLYCDMFKRR